MGKIKSPDVKVSTEFTERTGSGSRPTLAGSGLIYVKCVSAEIVQKKNDKDVYMVKMVHETLPTKKRPDSDVGHTFESNQRYTGVYERGQRKGHPQSDRLLQTALAHGIVGQAFIDKYKGKTLPGAKIDAIVAKLVDKTAGAVIREDSYVKKGRLINMYHVLTDFIRPEKVADKENIGRPLEPHSPKMAAFLKGATVDTDDDVGDDDAVDIDEADETGDDLADDDLADGGGGSDDDLADDDL